MITNLALRLDLIYTTLLVVLIQKTFHLQTHCQNNLFISLQTLLHFHFFLITFNFSRIYIENPSESKFCNKSKIFLNNPWREISDIFTLQQNMPVHLRSVIYVAFFMQQLMLFVCHVSSLEGNSSPVFHYVFKLCPALVRVVCSEIKQWKVLKK